MYTIVVNNESFHSILQILKALTIRKVLIKLRNRL